VRKWSWQMYMSVAWLYMCKQESCRYPVNAQHNLYIMINLPPSPCLSQCLLSSKSHYYTTDVDTQRRQRSHNCSHRLYMMQSKEHWVQIKSNSIMFLHWIERRCHLYNPQDEGRKTQKIQMQESWCTWQWKNATGFSGKKFSELEYF